MRSTAALAGLTAAGLIVTGIIVGGDEPGATGRSRGHSQLVEAAGVGLAAFDACDTMTDELIARSTEQLTALNGMYYGMPIMDMAVGAMEEAADGVAVQADQRASAPTAPGEASGGADVSDTNVQVAGVDEPDLVETDGRRLFTVSDGRLHVLDISAGAPTLLSTTELTAPGEPQLLLDGDRLLVLGARWGEAGILDSDGATDMMLQGATHLALFDVAADTPRLLAEFEVEGHLVSARGIDGTVHAVISHQPMPLNPAALEEAAADVDWRLDAPEFRATYERELATTGAADWLPRMAVVDTAGTVQQREAVACTEVRATSASQDTSMLAVLTFDITGADLEPEATSAVLTSAQTVTASADRMVVATPIATTLDDPASDDGEPGGVEPQTDPAVQERTSDDIAVEPVEPGIVAPDFPGPAVRWDTRLHLFDLTSQGSTYVASGQVPGQVLNQFSMDLWNDTLRVATTVGEAWTGSSESQVAVLEQRGDRLETIGSVGGLGRGEQIYSVRFIGDRGYVVTFRQVDPLYTLDLSDPTDPTVEGELKITGYSAYLHPVGEHRLLGIGQEATTEGRRVGMQVSLFDTSDANNPTRLSQVVMPNADSQAEYDHHAILVHGDTVALPYGRWFEPTADRPEGYEVGAAILDLQDRSVDLRGTVAPTLGDDEKLDPWRAQIRRVVYLDGTLYLVGHGMITAVDAQSLAPIGELAY